MSAPKPGTDMLRPALKETHTMKPRANGRKRNRTISKASRPILALAAVVAVFASMTGIAAAAAPEIKLWSVYPDTSIGGVRAIEGGQPKGRIIRGTLIIENTGTAPMSGTVTLTQTAPVGLSFLSGGFELAGPGGGTCEALGQTVTCQGDVENLAPAGIRGIDLRWELDPTASGQLVTSIEVSGGGVADSVQRDEVLTVGPPLPFAVKSFETAITDSTGGEELQAGASPGTAANAFTIAKFSGELIAPFFITRGASAHPRNVVAHLPPGIVANFAATPVRCSTAQLNTPIPGKDIPSCPVDSQVGIAHVDAAATHYTVPVWSMDPPPGTPAQLGFNVQEVPILVNARLRPSDFGVDLVSSTTNATLPIAGVDVRIWGVPADSSHDNTRGLCYSGYYYGYVGGSCPAGYPRRAYVRLPTSCNGPLHWGIEMDSYEEPGVYKTKETTTPRQVGCNQLEFTPSMTVRPSTNLGDSPAGLDLSLHLPQSEDPDGLAQAHLKDLALKLPEGLTVNSGAADGQGACSPAEVGLLTAVGQVPARFDGEPAHCPDASKLGSVKVDTPALDHQLPGILYLATPQQNPFGALVALYLVIDDPVSGVIVKLPIKANLDPVTGQVTTEVAESPQLPFEDLTVELDRGSHAPLRTPVGCGKFTSSNHMRPWSSPEGKDVDVSDSFEIVKGAGAGGCVANEASAPFDPKFSAGMLDPTAGAFSPFMLKLSRADGTQALRGIEVAVPKGLLASLGGIPYCSEAAVNSIPTAIGTGATELAHPTCPAASQLGTLSASVGVGPSPYTVRTGRLYWTGPYKGAPVGLVAVVPAVAGPFDLGNVVTRVGFYVDPETAKITAKSDPIPTMLHGIPINLRSVRADLDRPNYTLNPTSCDPMSFEADLTSSTGQVAHRSDRFQVGGCGNLGFKPKLKLRLDGGTTRAKHPALTATLTFPKKRGANIARASVSLPPSAFLDQSHIGTICTRVQFAADQCPAASVYGYARAYSPILDYYLAGPVYLRSSSHDLPDLVADLNGVIEVAVVGRIDTGKNGGIRTTFESVPDAPVSKFVLEMKGGKKGLLQNSTNICRGTHKATARFIAQNGKSVLLRPEMEAACSKRAKKKHQKRGSYSR